MYQGCTQILVEKQDKILLIQFNNPKKKNCVNPTVYKEIGRVLREVSADDTVSLVVFTGVGEFFTAGNDLSQATSGADDIEVVIKEIDLIFREMISAIIECPKILVSLVNGPAIGIGTTLVALCDLAWCAEDAYFLTPFVKLGLVPEACSSYLLPRIIGRTKATEMLLFSEKMSAFDAYQYNFVSKVFKLTELKDVIWPKLKELSELPQGSLQISKNLLRWQEKEALYSALKAECDELTKRFTTEEFMNALMEFSMRKNKSKL